MNAPHPPAGKRRLDVALVERGLVPTRARARDLVLRGEVSVDGVVSTKPAQSIGAGTQLSVLSPEPDYVSRGALKLAAALAHFAFDPAGRIALDIGASTGGFTELLIRRGAERVYAIENGIGQLHPRLIREPRVISRERTAARTLDSSVVPEPVTAIVADVSFISLAKVLPVPLTLAGPGCWLAALVKPQFEGEPGTIPRDGIVKSEADRVAATERIAQFIGAKPSWRVLGIIPSPIHGGSGNQEYLIGAERDA